MCGGGGEFGYLNIPQRPEFYVVCIEQKDLTWYNILRRNITRINWYSLWKVCESTNKNPVMDCKYTMQV